MEEVPSYLLSECSDFNFLDKRAFLSSHIAQKRALVLLPDYYPEDVDYRKIYITDMEELLNYPEGFEQNCHFPFDGVDFGFCFNPNDPIAKEFRILNNNINNCLYKMDESFRDTDANECKDNINETKKILVRLLKKFTTLPDIKKNKNASE